MVIKVLGPGCAKCKTLETLVKQVVDQNSIEATIIKVDDIIDIMSYNVIAPPALVVNEKVMIKGRVPSENEIKEILISVK